jgi:hypothetical protein
MKHLTSIAAATEKLELAWENGFFYNLRQAHFRPDEYLEVKKLIDSIEDSDEASETVNRRFVNLIWFIPTFISWQQERLISNGVRQEIIDEMSNYFYNQCKRLLGLP